MATTKTITIANAAGTSKQFAPEVLSSDVATDAIYRSMIGVDWGEAPRTQFLLPRPMRDGQFYRGGVYDARTMTWQLLSRVNPSSASFASVGAEPVRDDEETVLNGFFLDPAGAPFWLQQTRTKAGGGTVKRRIGARLSGFRSWKWSPGDISDGMVGTHAGPVLVKSLDWFCPYPWLVSYDTDADIVTSSGNTLDDSDRSVVINNPGDIPCGVKVTISGASGTTTVTITNGYSTGSYGTPNNSISVTSVAPAGGSYIIDWFGSDPLTGTAVLGSTDYTTNVAAGSLIQLARGNNTLHYTTSSVVTSWTIRFDVYPLWGSP